jgi:hypothetical protein
MSTPNLPDADTLILDELDIPGRTGPVSASPTVWGINIAAAEGNFPRQGLLCRAGPWSSMAEGDLIKVHWGPGPHAVQKTVDQDDVNTTLQLFVPSSRISDGPSTVSYIVKRLGQTEEPSADLQVLVKLTRPGGHDDNDDPGHSKLIMHIPQEIIDGGVDADNVAAGVPITIERYPNAAVGDVIQLSWGGVFVLGAPLTQAQVDGTAPIIVHVSEATIREADDSDSVGLSVAFEVYDVVDNRSEDWSVAQRVVVAIDLSRLEAPILIDAQNNLLDVDKLGNADGTAHVWVTASGSFKLGDTPVIRIKGTPVEGAPVDVEFTGAPLTSVPTTAKIPIPNAVLRQFAKSQMALSYRLEKADGSPDLRAKTQFINVIGTIQRLAAPIALEAVSGALDPALKQVRVEIPFDASFAAGQAIQLFWLGTRPELSPYLPELPLRPITNGDISAGLPLLIHVDGAHLAPINGGKLELYYHQLIEDSVLDTMNHVNATHAVRESIHADILQVGEPRLELPEPLVAGVVDGTLPADTNGTTLTVNHLKTSKGDVVIYEWVGSKTGTATDSVTLTSFTAGQPVAFPIKAELIKGNEGGSVSASYLIKWAAGGTSYSNPLAFRVGAELVTPVITSVKDPYGKEVPNGTTVTNDYVTLTGTATAGLEIEIFDGTTAKGKATVNDSGVWTLSVGGLEYGAHSLTAKGVYGSNPVSAARTFVVAHALVPAITSVKDSKGVDIPQNGTTVDISVTLTGTGTANREVEIFDGVTSKGKRSVDAIGVWTYTDTALTVAAHSFKAKADYGSGTESAVRTFTVVTEAAPVITSVLDSKDVAIPQNGLTVDPNVKLSGTATPNLDILIFNNGVSTGGRATADAQGKWNRNLTGLALGECNLTAVAQYGSGPESAVWKVIVTALVAPTITSIKDSKGVEIPQGGSTVDTSVTITGTASKGQKVDVLDGPASKGKSPVDPTTGVWTLAVSGLTIAAHSFTAKAEYGTEPVSAARTFTVAALATPVITSVKDPYDKDVPNGSTITNDNVTLTGTATAGLEIEIFDGPTAKGKATANASGVWTRGVGGLANGQHSLTAKGVYGSNPVSVPRIFVVADALVPAITSVKDSKGVDIPQNGTTVDTSVTLTGTGTANREVEIFDGVTSKGKRSVNAQEVWTYTDTALTVAAHSFKAKALYGGETESPVRSFTCVALITPVITSIKDAKGELAHDATTISTILTLTGRASNSQNVQIFDNNVPKYILPVSTNGDWSTTTFAAPAGTHSITVMGIYGGQPVSSPARTFKVISFAEGYIDWVDEPVIRPLPFNTPTNFKNKITLTTKNIAAHAAPAIQGHGHPGGVYILSGAVVINRFEFTGAVHKITLRTSGSNDKRNRLTYFDEKGAMIESKELTFSATPMKINFSTSKYCTHFEFSIFDLAPDGGIGIYSIEWGQ